MDWQNKFSRLPPYGGNWSTRLGSDSRQQQPRGPHRTAQRSSPDVRQPRPRPLNHNPNPKADARSHRLESMNEPILIGNAWTGQNSFKIATTTTRFFAVHHVACGSRKTGPCVTSLPCSRNLRVSTAGRLFFYSPFIFGCGVKISGPLSNVAIVTSK